MLTLNDGRLELWQWDTGRKITVDADCSQVHFSNKVFGRSIDVDVIDGVSTIPDILLQTDKELNVWAFVGTAENGYTKVSKTFKVNSRNKPADYVFTPVEQTTIAEISAIAQSVRDDADAGLFNGKRGADGGWYTPSGTQPDENTLRMAFTPSKDDMPNVAHTDITLPVGGYYTPSVDAAGNLSWSASKADMPEVAEANIMGPKGDAGPQGPKGDTGEAGQQGPAGADGKDNLPNVAVTSGTDVTLTMDNNVEYHCTDAVTALTIEGFTPAKDGKGSMWALQFTAGDEITVTVPDTVKWAVVEPVFTAGVTYWLTFVPLITGDILGVWVSNE